MEARFTMEKISSASCARKAFKLPYGKSVKLEHSLHTNIPKKKKKKNSRRLKDLNIRHDTIKLLEKNIDKTSSGINHKICS